MSENISWNIRSVELGDEAGWKKLFRAYRDFYKYAPDEDVVAQIWDWIFDDSRVTQALVAADANNEVVGIANIRVFPRNLVAGKALWLDDLFTLPELRGKGVARALLDALKDKANAEGYNAVRWITAEDNSQARELYDKVAQKTVWVTYDLKLDA